MDTDDLQKFAQSGRFIPGIYNYCDRWCERCSMSSRCLVFAMDRELFADHESADIRNAAFWEKLTGLLHAATELLRKRAEEEGLDLESITDPDPGEGERRRDAAQHHACSVMAKCYAEMAQAWLDRTTVDTVQAVSAGHDISLKEALDVIRWYQHQIHIKVMRALQSDWDEPDESTDEIPDDAGVQAKIVLMGIDRSIAAWDVIRKHTPGSDDDLLDLMVTLDRMRRYIEQVFPHARSIIRPGFEEIDQLREG
jgi:hypothetical protein